MNQNQVENKNQTAEEYAWAVQNLANTQHQLNNEIDLKNKQQDMMSAQRDHNLSEKQAKEARWPNMYGDQNALPEVTQNMEANANVRPLL